MAVRVDLNISLDGVLRSGLARVVGRRALGDRRRVAVRPVVLGRGTRLWDGLGHLHDDYRVTSEVAESGVVHVTFSR